MNLKLTPYKLQQERLPKAGKHIVAQQDTTSLIVYQAFNPRIAHYAVNNQRFGGSHYSFNRMTWIKPNFLWMMYRAGWASKVNQESILAIRLKREVFIKILEDAIHSSFKAHLYENRENWQAQMAKSAVRLQWDPAHDPYGNKLERRAIQLGMKGDILSLFNEEGILEIQDVTPFVKEQHAYVLEKDLDKLQIPEETVFEVSSENLKKKLELS